MDAIPGPRRAYWPHVAIPFLADISCFPDPDSWRSTLPKHVKGTADVIFNSSPSENTSAERKTPGKSGREVICLDIRSRPINREPTYFDIYPQADEHEKGSFVHPEGLILKSRNESLEAHTEKLRRTLDISDATSIRYEEYSDRCVLSERAKQAKPSSMLAAVQQYMPGQSYDGKGFRSFPERQGLESWMLDYEWDSDEFCAFFHQVSPEETAIFVQSWLYFGLLSEVFGKQVREKDFVTTIDAHHDIITLQKFHTTNQWKSWESELGALGLEEQKPRADAVRYALDIASKMTRLEDRGYMTHIPFSGEIALSVRVLGAIFSDVCHRSNITGVFDLPQRFSTCQQWGIGKILNDRLMSRPLHAMSDHFMTLPSTLRWCPNDIARMKLHLPVTAIYFLSNLISSAGLASINARVNHGGYSNAHYVGDSIDEAVYETEHSVLCHGSCQFVEPDMDKVEEILEQGGIPIFQFKKSQSKDGLFTDLNRPETMAAFEAIFHKCGLEYYKRSIPGIEVIDASKELEGVFGVNLGEVLPEILWQEPLELEVLRYDGETPYVAISHVWADGLGNARGNGIPACRLPFIRRMLWQSNCPMQLHPGLDIGKGLVGYLSHVHELGGIWAHLALTKAPIPAFWIDTFGIPRRSSAKRAAIQRMSDTYRHSSKVLVIDGRLAGSAVGGRALGNHCEARPVDELLGLILTAPWMRRLWTLQEALLSKNLLIMFSEGPVDVQNLLSGVVALRSGPNDSVGALVREQLAHSVAEIALFVEKMPCQGRFRTVWNASVGRTATKSGDISLCLATALGMDASLLYERAEHERSKVFYSLLPLLPSDIARGFIFPIIDSSMIFSHQEKLSEYGFRWADRELCVKPLAPSQAAQIVPFPHTGLMLRLPAAEFNLAFDALGSPSWNLRLPGKGRMLEAVVHQRLTHLEQASSETFFLILENNVDWTKPSPGRTRGLLASLDLRIPRFPGMMEQVCIECYVEVSSFEYLTPTTPDVGLDLDSVGPCFELGDFRDLPVVLR